MRVRIGRFPVLKIYEKGLGGYLPSPFSYMVKTSASPAALYIMKQKFIEAAKGRNRNMNSNTEPQFLSVGKIANTHGIRGELKIFPFTDFPEVRFAAGKRLLLISPEDGSKLPVKILSAREQKNVYVVKLDGYDNINQVEKYKGWDVKVPKEEAVEEEENAYYFHEIMGCKVLTEQGEELGVVTDILTPGANDVWVVKSGSGKELLIPYIESIVKSVDIAAKTVRIEVMEGLLD